MGFRNSVAGVCLIISLTALAGGCRPLNSPSNVPSWRVTFVDGGGEAGLNVSPHATAYYPQLLSHNRDLHVTWYEKTAGSGVDQIRVARLTGEGGKTATWEMIDGGGLTGINADVGRPARWSRLIGFAQRLYAYWYEEDEAGVTRIRVAVRTEDASVPSWRLVDNGGLNASVTKEALYASIAESNGKLYAAWQESDGVAYQIRFAVYNGNDAAPEWTLVDGGESSGINRDPAKDAYYPKLLAHDGALYRLWPEKSDGSQQMRAARYNGNDLDPAWSSIDSSDAAGISFNRHRIAHSPSLVVWQDSLVATWHEDSALTGAGTIRVARLRTRADADQANWQFLDGATESGLNSNPGSDAQWSRTAVVEDTLFVAWAEGTPSGQRIQLAALEDANGEWTRLAAPGLNLYPRSHADVPHLTAHNGTLYVTWSERAGGRWHSRVAAVVLEQR